MIYIVEAFAHGVEVRCATEGWIGVQVLRIVPKIGIVYEAFLIHQVFLVEYKVKTSQCREDTNI